MKLSNVNICRISFLIYFFLLSLLFCAVNAGIGDIFQRWFPKTKLPTNAPGRPERLDRFSIISDDDEQQFNNTLSHILVPRVPGTKSHDAVAKYIVDYLRRLEWDVEEDKFTSKTPMGEKPYNNIIATLNPNGCKKIVLACHYDSKYFPEFDFLAASDSAVPCAMILELARVLHWSLQNSLNRDVSLQLIFFDGEEAWVHWSRTDSTYGSRHLARRWRKEAPKASSCPANVRTEMDRLDLFMLLDLIGEKDASFCNSYPAALPYFNHLSDIESRLRRYTLLEGRHSSYGYFRRSSCGFSRIEDDQLPFELSGVRKILHLIAVPFPRVWHHKNDDAKMIDYPTVRNLLKIFRIFLIEHLRLNF